MYCSFECYAVITFRFNIDYKKCVFCRMSWCYIVEDGCNWFADTAIKIFLKIKLNKTVGRSFCVIYVWRMGVK